jgi:hypothetical protein
METAMEIVKERIPNGPGQPGYCKICDNRLLPAINKKLVNGVPYTQIIAWAAEFNESFVRQTLAKHKEHIKHPKVTFVEQARRNPIIVPSSNEEFLDAVRDAGMAKIKDDPDSVTVGQALKAAQISMQSKQNNKGINIVLIGVMTGRADEVIEGEWKETT